MFIVSRGRYVPPSIHGIINSNPLGQQSKHRLRAQSKEDGFSIERTTKKANWRWFRYLTRKGLFSNAGQRTKFCNFRRNNCSGLKRFSIILLALVNVPSGKGFSSTFHQLPQLHYFLLILGRFTLFSGTFSVFSESHDNIMHLECMPYSGSDCIAWPLNISMHLLSMEPVCVRPLPMWAVYVSTILSPCFCICMCATSPRFRSHSQNKLFNYNIRTSAHRPRIATNWSIVGFVEFCKFLVQIVTL